MTKEVLVVMNPIESISISLAIFILILLGLSRGMRKPIKKSGIRLLLPIAYISTSLLQLLDPELYVSSKQLFISIMIGFVISLPLIATTNFVKRENGDTFIQSTWLIFALLTVLFMLRIILIPQIHSVDQSTLAVLSSIVMVSYITVWRSVSFVKFRRTVKSTALFKG
ncbi:CcdC protein domain-containing protein [Paenibacillus sinopodophylli]|uniref:CcdC protein domain-containing protein n=1 Tax=Paenibacillus sinopodophylli TaxID=1837342 RepID=UPI001FEC5710|nr:CcdC protein domain-containing protein [Paenibacillus sinopodophylli]